MKNVVVSQPMFIPWIGIFEQIALADTFYHYIDIQYPKGRSFMSRVQLLGNSGQQWLTAPIDKNTLAIFVSQSGETADTLAALRYCRGKVEKIISIVNVPESSIARESDMIIPILAGPEISVASTKGFTNQLAI